MRRPSFVAQVSEPAVSPTSQSAGPRWFGATRTFPALAGWETRDTAGWEACATTVEQAAPIPVSEFGLEASGMAQGPDSLRRLRGFAAGAGYCDPDSQRKCLDPATNGHRTGEVRGMGSGEWAAGGGLSWIPLTFIPLTPVLAASASSGWLGLVGVPESRGAFRDGGDGGGVNCRERTQRTQRGKRHLSMNLVPTPTLTPTPPIRRRIGVGVRVGVRTRFKVPMHPRSETGLPMNRSAAVLKASRSVFQPAAAGLRHSRAPVLGFKARIGIRRILTPALSPTDAERG